MTLHGAVWVWGGTVIIALLALALLFVTPLAQTGGLTLRQSVIGLAATFLLGLAGWLLDGQEVK